jgi:ADP-ribose pyrophosphatase
MDLETTQPPRKTETLARTTVYRSSWVNLYLDRALFPNGRIIEQHHVLEFDHQAVMAIPRRADGRFLMVQVCRHPTGRIEWEFPAGSIEAGEDILEAARREVLEETGCSSFGHTLLYTYHPMNGIADQVFHVVRCQVEEPSEAFDAGEISAVRPFKSEEIWSMIRSGEMMDGYTLTAFLLDEAVEKGAFVPSAQ